MENEQKIKDSKGNIYDSCPYIDKIISTLEKQLNLEEQFSFYDAIRTNLEIIRKINQELRNLRDKKIQELEEKIQSFQEISDKYEIVNDLLGIDAKDLRWVKHNTQDRADKLKRLEELEKENEELKEEIDNIKQ
jgi:DNA repair exonuclease SbcCD ATPase subunit